MTDMTHDTELTPRDREMMRKGYARRMVDLGSERCVADSLAALVIPDPPAYTSSAEVKEPWATGHMLRRRSDGVWQFMSRVDHTWTDMPDYRDAYVRALAACVPLSDAECAELLTATWIAPINGVWAPQVLERVRAAFARVMRGEVAHG